MRIFVAGASGAIGKRLFPLLVENGHEVVGTTRSPEKVGSLRASGAEPRGGRPARPPRRSPPRCTRPAPR
jgi:uncharacterized protein YbjT (DUF2867 family)